MRGSGGERTWYCNIEHRAMNIVGDTKIASRAILLANGGGGTPEICGRSALPCYVRLSK